MNFVENEIIKNVNFLKNEILKMWILWKIRLWKCDFENVNFMKIETLKMWILGKMIFSKCEFLDELRSFVPVCIPTQWEFVIFGAKIHTFFVKIDKDMPISQSGVTNISNWKSQALKLHYFLHRTLSLFLSMLD